MTTTALPPVGSVWVRTNDPHDIVIVTGYSTIRLKHVGSEHNIINIHKVNTNIRTSEIFNQFTWIYEPLESGEQQ